METTTAEREQVAEVIRAHAVVGMSMSSLMCSCDGTWRDGDDYRAHLTDAVVAGSHGAHSAEPTETGGDDAAVDLRTRLVQAEAVIQKVLEQLLMYRDQMLPGVWLAMAVGHTVQETPATVLAEHDREVAARSIERYRKVIEDITRAHAYAMDEDDWDEHHRLVAALTNYARAVRAGREGSPV